MNTPVAIKVFHDNRMAGNSESNFRREVRAPPSRVFRARRPLCWCVLLLATHTARRSGRALCLSAWFVSARRYHVRTKAWMWVVGTDHNSHSESESCFHDTPQAEVLRRLRHPNIINFLGLAESADASKMCALLVDSHHCE